MPSSSLLQRVAYSPGEFAKLFGKSQTWGYRQIYAGKVKAITEHGRFMVPSAEVERILGSAAEYTGAKRPKIFNPSKAAMEERNKAWKTFVAAKRGGKADGEDQPSPPNGEPRAAVLRRLARK